MSEDPEKLALDLIANAAMLVRTLRQAHRIEFDETNPQTLRIDRRVILEPHTIVTNVSFPDNENKPDEVSELGGFVIRYDESEIDSGRPTDVIGFTTGMAMALSLAIAAAEELIRPVDYPRLMAEAILKYESASDPKKVN